MRQAVRRELEDDAAGYTSIALQWVSLALDARTPEDTMSDTGNNNIEPGKNSDDKGNCLWSERVRRNLRGLTMRHARHNALSDALAQREEMGGWVIDHGDCYWWTDDEGTAVDLTLSLVDEDRTRAEEIVRDPKMYTQGAPIIAAGLLEAPHD